MIKYSLNCGDCTNTFEGWFPDSKDFTKQKDIIIPPKKPTTTKTGTGGGGFTPTTTAQNIARTASRVDSSGNVKAYGLAKGGLARMLGE